VSSATTSWLPARAARASTPLDAIFGLRPNLYAAFRDMSAVFWEQRLVDPVILELCRLRVAALHGCRSELRLRYAPARDVGLAEDKIQALEHYESDPRFSPAERACLRLAERFTLDANDVRDEDAAAVVAALGEQGAVGLLLALALFDGFSRFRVILGVEPESSAVRVVPAPASGAASME
jgi:alkylhydroperoxidase family enzyme